MKYTIEQVLWQLCRRRLLHRLKMSWTLVHKRLKILKLDRHF